MGGNSSAIFSANDLAEYADLLYLKKSEILQIYKRITHFCPIVKSRPDNRMNQGEFLMAFPVFAHNPFLSRIFAVFSSKQDNLLSFEDILDLHSALSPNCPVNVKAEWAFRVFDYDGDGQIGSNDLINIINAIVKETDSLQPLLTDGEKEHIAASILSDLDLDQTGGVTASEFAHAVLKMPEFAMAFQVVV